jgi:hypothetical protein
VEEDEDAMSTDDKNGAVGGEDEDVADEEDEDLEEEVYGHTNAPEPAQRSLTPVLDMW